jgi:hypothetical protein
MKNEIAAPFGLAMTKKALQRSLPEIGEGGEES